MSFPKFKCDADNSWKRWFNQQDAGAGPGQFRHCKNQAGRKESERIQRQGRAVALLGNSPDTFDQVWHLLADQTPLTGKEFISLAGSELGTEAKYTVMKNRFFKATPSAEAVRETAASYR